MTIVAFLVALVGALTYLEIDVIARAQGRLIHSERVSRVLATYSGRVRHLLVADGQIVKAGEPLLELDPEVVQADVQRMQAKLYEAQLRYALYANQPLPSVESFDRDERIRRSVVNKALAEQELHRSRLKVAQQDLQLASAKVDAEKASQEKAVATLPLVRERLSMAEALVSQGFQSPASLLVVQQDLLEAARQVAIGAARVSEQKLTLTQRELALKELVADYERSVADKVQLANAEEVSISNELARAREVAKLGIVTAQARGTVEQFSKELLSNFVKAGDPLMILVPEEDVIEAEVSVRNEDIPHLRVGQTARIKFAAYPFTIFGTAEGQVSFIPREPATDDKKDADTTAFKIRIKPSASIARLKGQDVPLKSGMLVDVDILIGRRSPIDLILSPFRRFSAEAFSDA